MFSECYIRILGRDQFGFGFGGTGKKSWNNQFDEYGQVSHYMSHHSLSLSLSLPLPQPFGKDDTIGCYINLDDGEILFSKNGNIVVMMTLFYCFDQTNF